MTTQSPSPPTIPEVAAARLMAGDLKLLQDGLSRGLRVDATWPMWECPLLHGVCIFAPAQAALMASLIIKAGARMDVTYRGMSPMLCALGGFNRETGDALGARLALLKVLHEADPNPQLELWAMSAVRVGYKDALSYFIDSGCNPNAALDEGHSLLHEAYSKQQVDIGNLLIKTGANMEQRDARGRKPNEVNSSMEPGRPGAREELEAVDLAIRSLDNSDTAPESRHLRL